MSFCFRRLYATLPKSTVVPPSVSARASSTPLQVRRRRLRKQLSAPRGAGASETSPSSLSPTEKDRYERLRRVGALLREKDGFREPTEEEWLAELNEQRTRIRGASKKEVKDEETGQTAVVEDVVGQRIYLPNIIFRMMRNHTPPGTPYNPWEATFRIPQSVTKLDIRSYLYAVYGVKCTYIRTDNYFKPVWRGRMKGHPLSTSGKTRKSYKRAVVGLVEPFYFPDAMEDMDLTERQKREEWIEEHFRPQASRDYVAQRQRAAWNETPGWKNFNLAGNRGVILRSVLARRSAREQAVDEGARALLQPRSTPSEVEEA